MNDFPSFQNSFSKVLQNHLNLRATGWNPQKHLFFQKIIILAIIKIISKSSAAWTAVFVYSCGSPLKFSPKDHGRPDPRTWRRASRAAAALFGSWKMVKLCQIRQNPEIVAKKIDFLSLFVFSICFRFFVFFSIVFFVFVFGSCRFFSFLNQI